MKYDDNLVLFLCRGSERKKVSFRTRDAVPKFKYKVPYAALSMLIWIHVYLLKVTSITCTSFGTCYSEKKRDLSSNLD